MVLYASVLLLLRSVLHMFEYQLRPWHLFLALGFCLCIHAAIMRFRVLLAQEDGSPLISLLIPYGGFWFDFSHWEEMKSAYLVSFLGLGVIVGSYWLHVHYGLTAHLSPAEKQEMAASHQAYEAIGKADLVLKTTPAQFGFAQVSKPITRAIDTGGLSVLIPNLTARRMVVIQYELPPESGDAELWEAFFVKAGFRRVVTEVWVTNETPGFRVIRDTARK